MPSGRGISRERDVQDLLESQDWVVARCAGSLGPFDLVALKLGKRPRLIEVKSTITPYSHFGPKDRADLRFASEMADAEPWLAWWPKHGKLHWLHGLDWPDYRAEKREDIPF